MYSMPRSWSERQIQRMVGPDVQHPLATTHRHVAWENPVLRLEQNLVRNAATSQDSFAVRITSAAEPYYACVVVPLSTGGRFHLVARYRYPIGRWSIEFPRFDLDSSEAGWKDAAQADLLRATGLVAKRLNLLGAIQVDPSLMATSAVVILAEGCKRARPRSISSAEPNGGGAPGPRFGTDELIAGSLNVSPAKLSKLLVHGEIGCAVTLAALSLYRARLQ